MWATVQLLIQPSLRRPLGVCLVLMAAQQLSGINNAFNYSSSFFLANGLNDNVVTWIAIAMNVGNVLSMLGNVQVQLALQALPAPPAPAPPPHIHSPADLLSSLPQTRLQLPLQAAAAASRLRRLTIACPLQPICPPKPNIPLPSPQRQQPADTRNNSN